MDRNLKLAIILFLIFIASFSMAFYIYNPLSSNNNLSPDLSNILNSNPFSPGEETSFSIVTLGSTDYGSVTREGPYGNTGSPHKIAIIAGVHPQEAQSHNAFIKSLQEHNSTLKNCYYVYKVNVTRDADNYEKGRNNGQKIANQYLVPDIKNKNFDLVIDVHSNRGNYERRRFVSVPAGSAPAENIASQLVQKLNWLIIYDPPNPTSPEYVTIPLIKSGIPAIIYETYGYEPYNQSKKQADQFIVVLDQVEI